MPPPVDPGDAPINMRTATVKSPALVNPPRLKVENPAVLADTLVKNAPSQVIFSVARMSTVPPINRMALVVITALECRVSFLKDRLVTMSMMTKNPRPPKVISPAVVRFSSTLSRYPVRFLSPPKISNPELLNAAMEWNTLIPSA